MKVLVDNRNTEHERFCTAFGGEQVQINPGAKQVPIDERFTWKMDPDISLSRGGKNRTFKTADEEAKDRAEAEKREKEQKTTEKEVKPPVKPDEKDPVQA